MFKAESYLQHMPQVQTVCMRSLFKTLAMRAKVSFVCLLAKNLRKDRIDCEENLRKQSLHIHLQLVDLCSPPKLRGLPQLISFDQHKSPLA